MKAFIKNRMIGALTAMILIMAAGHPQAPQTLWMKTYGGSDSDHGYSVQETSDGGFIIAGEADYGFGFESGDLWLIRTNSAGDTLWTKTYARAGIDVANAVHQMADDGFIVAGYTTTPDGLNRDAWLLRTDSDGDTLWSKTYGGGSTDDASDLLQTADGGFILAGRTYSAGTTFDDGFLIRTDAGGDTLWTRKYSGPGSDRLKAVQQTADGGFILSGQFLDWNSGAPDLWLIRTDAGGDTLWTRTFNGPHFDWSFDYASDILLAHDGGFVVLGAISGLMGVGNEDVWLLRTDANGDTLWTQSYGGTGLDRPTSIAQAADGGYIIGGYHFASGTDIDAFLIRTDAAGDSLWTITFGDSGYDQITTVRRTSDNGFILGGFSSSYSSGDNDAWLIRLESGDPTSIGGMMQPMPFGFVLMQNYPNPFNPTTVIRYSLSVNSFVTLEIYDINGSLVKRAINEQRSTGSHEYTWDGRNGAGKPVASGVYVYRMTAANHTRSLPMVLMR